MLFFYVNREEITFQFLMSYRKSVVPGYKKTLLKLSYVLLNLLDFLFIYSHIMPLKYFSVLHSNRLSGN